MIRFGLAAIALGVGALAVSACNTVHGLGRDIESAGRAIARSSDDVRSDSRAKRPAPAPSQQRTTTTGGS